MGMATEATEASELPASKPDPPQCAVCQQAVAKYRCPACDLRSCSLACASAHKRSTGCTGKRPVAKFVAPVKAFTDELVMRDFGFLSEVDAAVDRASRDEYVTSRALHLHQTHTHRKRITLARACAAPERLVKLVMAPGAMSLARHNTTKVKVIPPANGTEGKEAKGDGKDAKGKGKEAKGKGKEAKGKGKGKGKEKGKKGKGRFDENLPTTISWRVEWHFAHCGRTLVHKGMRETERLDAALSKMLENDPSSGQAMKHLLLPYAEAGVDKLEVFLQQPRRAQLATQLATFDSMASACSVGCESDSSEAEEDPIAVEKGSDEDSQEGEADTSEDEGDTKTPQGRKRKRGEQQEACPFIQLDKTASLQENLRNRAIVEFPVLHVALPSELSKFVPCDSST